MGEPHSGSEVTDITSSHLQLASVGHVTKPDVSGPEK